MTIATTRTIKVKQFIPNYVYIDNNKYIIFGGFKPSQNYSSDQPIIPFVWLKTKNVWTHQSVVAFNSHEYPIPAGFSWCAIPKNAWVIATKLLGGIPTPLKNMSSSVGIILPNIWKVIKHGFQTTNQKSVANSSFSGAFPWAIPPRPLGA